MTEALNESLRRLDPRNPWVKDSEGKHTNLSALYDWPDDNSDEDDIDQVTRSKSQILKMLINSFTKILTHGGAVTVSLLGKCERGGCIKPRARNPRNGEIHSYCSLRCSRMSTSVVECPLNYGDHEMDIFIALEMSRLQLIEDEFVKHLRSEPIRSHSHTTEDIEEAQLQLAIQLSLEGSRNNDQAKALSVSLENYLKVPSKGGSEILLRNYHCEPDGAKPEVKIAKALLGNYNLVSS